MNSIPCCTIINKSKANYRATVRQTTERKKTDSLSIFSSKKCACIDEREKKRLNEWTKTMYMCLQCRGHLHFYAVVVSLNQSHLLTSHTENPTATVYGQDWTVPYIKYFITFFLFQHIMFFSICSHPEDELVNSGKKT